MMYLSIWLSSPLILHSSSSFPSKHSVLTSLESDGNLSKIRNPKAHKSMYSVCKDKDVARKSPRVQGVSDLKIFLKQAT